jgi:predicted transcriptional regulator
MKEQLSMGRPAFTPEEYNLIKRDYAAYVPVSETARKLGRSKAGVRQKILQLGLRRSSVVTKLLAIAPEYLKALVGKIPSHEWREKYRTWRRETLRQARTQRLEAQTRKTCDAAAKGAEIDARNDLTRNEKMVAMREAGMTLSAVGKQYGITRETVRMIVKKIKQRELDRDLLEANIKAVRAGDVDAMPISEIGLPVRAFNALKNDGVKTVGDLCRRSEADLRRTLGIGVRSLNDVKYALAQFGRSL